VHKTKRKTQLHPIIFSLPCQYHLYVRTPAQYWLDPASCISIALWWLTQKRRNCWIKVSFLF